MNSEIAELTNELRNKSDNFTGEDSPEEVIQSVLSARIEEIGGHEQELAEKRASLKADLTGKPVELEESGSGNETAGDEIAQRQAELRDEITGGN